MAVTSAIPVRSRPLLPLAVVSALTAAGYALAGPFLSLFLIRELGSAPFAVGAFLLASSVAALVAGTLVGRLSDRRAVRRALLVAGSLAGAAGYALFAVLREYWLLLAVSVTLGAMASSLMPQTFAYARQSLERTGSTRAPLAISGLRTLSSLTWVVGPPLAAILVGVTGFRGVFALAAVIYLLAAAVVVRWLPELGDPGGGVAAAGAGGLRAEVVLAAVAFVLLQGATAVGVLAMPLFVTDVLGGTTADAGFVLGLCAALEIPLMLGFGALAVRVDRRRVVLAGAAVALAYYAVVLAAGAVWQVAAAQALHAVVISAVMGVGISYFQDFDPARPGRATTLYTNTANLSAMLSGPLLAVAQHFGYRAAYGIGLAMSVVGLGLLLAARPRPVGAGHRERR